MIWLQGLLGATRWRRRSSFCFGIGPATPHDETRTSATDVICVGFTLEKDGAPLPEGVYRDDPSSPLLPLLTGMLEELRTMRLRYGRMLDLAASQLAIVLERRLTADETAAAADSLQYTLNFMNEHFTQKIDVAALAAMAGYSYDRYRHLFKTRTGCSPVRYVVRKRLDYARTLLRHTKLSVASIAMECGFSSDAQFCSVFKRECGITPLTYRDPKNGESTTTFDNLRKQSRV